MKKIIIFFLLISASLAALAWPIDKISSQVNETYDGGGQLFIISEVYSCPNPVAKLTEFRYGANTIELNYRGQNLTLRGPEIWHQEQSGKNLLIITTYRPILPAKAKKQSQLAARSDFDITGIIPLFMIIFSVAMLIYFRKKDKKEKELELIKQFKKSHP